MKVSIGINIKIDTVKARNITEDIVKFQNLRMAKLQINERTQEMMQTITLQDVKRIKNEEQVHRKRIGYKN